MGQEGRAISAAVNELIRRGLAQRSEKRRPFEQETSDMKAKIDVTYVAEALELLEGPSAR